MGIDRGVFTAHTLSIHPAGMSGREHHRTKNIHQDSTDDTLLHPTDSRHINHGARHQLTSVTPIPI